MNRAPQTWLLPTALVGYVALASLRGRAGAIAALPLLIPVALALALRLIARRAESGHILTSVKGVRTGAIGLALFFAALSGPSDEAALRAAAAVGLGMLVCGTLFCVARQTPPPGLLRGHPAANSLDAFYLGVTLWTLTSSAILLRAILPDEFPLDPIALDTAIIFSALGSLLLLVAVLIRTKILRGLEMGVGDRAQAALTLAIAGTALGAGSGFVRMSTSDGLASLSIAGTCGAIILAVSTPNAAAVSRTVRGLLALLLLGTPVALLGAFIATTAAQHPAAVALGIAALSMLVGLIARSVARPLAPEGSRWLNALKKSMSAALHPQPDMALRAALMELRQAEPSSKTRPEVFRVDPPAMLSVDIAGYLTEKTADFPLGVLSFAENEPSGTLRLESILAAQVRQPKVRPLVTWFEAHRAKTATVLLDEAGPVGLLILPRGIRKSQLSMEEAELLAALCERLAGLISVSASLRRSRDRELDYQKQAEASDATAEELREQLEEQKRSDHTEAEARVEILRAAAHSPAAQIKLQELEALAHERTIIVQSPVGVDPVPWAAHLHLHRNQQTEPESPLPLVIVDCGERVLRTGDFWDVNAEASPWRRAASGTLVLVHPYSLPDETQNKLADALEKHHPALLIVCQSKNDNTNPRLKTLLMGPTVCLPGLEERAEDLQALIINELSQLGLTQRGSPYGIERAALYELIQRKFPGNDSELKGILVAAAARASGDRILMTDLNLSEAHQETPEPPPVVQARTRARTAPRTRRR